MTEEIKSLEEQKIEYDAVISALFDNLIREIHQIPVDRKELAPLIYTLQSAHLYTKGFINSLVDLKMLVKENPVNDIAPETNGNDKNDNDENPI